ncbi:hypothetical protein DM01DRAFT_1333451 [Hesseltinella vesiculosa]|uniref:Uncharacterized protein n=1 Tax=Hesseltinella vesiculosa TaxID=101127 RepID=A0A1X2GQ05_9FUNG|nr:hypothetical protein DM01DRAFT_1333451 [Hesseltinella vesiculosa]
MPLASMLETNKPFVFTNGSPSNELPAPSKTKLTSPSSTERYTFPSSSKFELDSHRSNGYHIAYTQDSMLAAPGAPLQPSKHHSYTNASPDVPITLPPPSALGKPFVKLEDPSSHSLPPPPTNSAPLSQPPAPSLSSTSPCSSTASLSAHSLVNRSPPPLPPAVLNNPVVSQPHVKKPQHHHDDDAASLSHYDTTAADNRRLKRRKDLNQRVEFLNNEFLKHKERLFGEKLMMIQTEIDQALNDTHTKYQEGLLMLETIRQKSMTDSRMFRDYQKSVTDKQFLLEIRQAEEEYLTEKHEIREKLFAVLEDKRRKLKEDKDNYDLTFDVMMETQARSNKRSLRKRGMEHLFDDLQAMRCGITSHQKTNDFKHTQEKVIFSFTLGPSPIYIF